MTKRECAIVMAYTGVTMLQRDDLDIFYKYLEEKLGHPILTHELALKAIEYRIHKASKEDFLRLCENAED